MCYMGYQLTNFVQLGCYVNLFFPELIRAHHKKRPRRSLFLTRRGRHKMVAILQTTFSNSLSCILIQISLKFEPKAPIDDMFEQA